MITIQNQVVKAEDEEKYLNEQKERFVLVLVNHVPLLILRFSPFIAELEVDAMKQPKVNYFFLQFNSPVPVLLARIKN